MDAGDFPDSVKDRSNGWPGEKWLDIRQIDVPGPIMDARLDLAVEKECAGCLAYRLPRLSIVLEAIGAGCSR